jgi:uncharacterized membrane protein YkoI
MKPSRDLLLKAMFPNLSLESPMKKIVLAVALALPFAAFAASGDLKGTCSTKASKTTSKTELMKLAKVSDADARKAAMGDMKDAKITKGGIETEDGCLIYSFHVQEAGSKGATEVFVDAGTGKVLKTEKEGALRTALEKPVDKTKELAGKTKEAVTNKPSTNQAMPK